MKSLKRISKIQTKINTVLTQMISVGVVALIGLFLIEAPASGFTGIGSGTPTIPYRITNAAQLQEMQDDLNAHYVLGGDIDCSGTVTWNSGAGFVPIGTSSFPFTGTFDGQEHKITGLFINRPSAWLGLFGMSSNTIKNVGLVDVSITGNVFVGGLVGENYFGTITNSYATGSVTGGYSSVGGLVGWNYFGTITNSYATVSVTGHDYVGGLVGNFYGQVGHGAITNSYATGDVFGDVSANCLGGLVGWDNSGTITSSHATGSVTGGYYVGGLVGWNYDGAITNSYATGNATGTAVGGLGVGGLVGLVGYHGFVTLYGTITNSYATGNATGTANVGGLVGENIGTITNSYATGNATGTANVGGLVGENIGAITNSYWDTQTSGQSTSAGGTGKTTTEMKQQSTYETWDFVNIWAINPTKNNGYPYLLWQILPVIPPANQTPTANAGPDQIIEATGLDGAAVTLDGSGSSDDGQIQPLTYTWTWADGSATGVYPTVTLPLGTTTVTLAVFDGQLPDTDTVDVTVQDTTPPTFTSVPQDKTIRCDGNGNQADLLDWLASTVEAADICRDVAICGEVTIADDFTDFPYDCGNTGSVTVTWTAEDAYGNTATVSRTFTIEDPTRAVTYDGDMLLSTGGSLTVNANLIAKLHDSAGDVPDIDGKQVTFTLTADGIGTIIVTADTQNGVAQTVRALQPAIYMIEVTLGCSDFTASAILVVYNPDGGFATGGGWFVPEADGLNTHPSVRANFGFNAKYNKGDPTGHLEFRYSDGYIDLKSSSVEQLVITGGRIVQFKGLASVNGEGDNSFFVKAIDNGEPGSYDNFEIKIWDPGADPEGDPSERAGGVLEGGNIVVHAK